MKFVFITTMRSAAWGGSEVLWFQTALRLREKGHVVDAVFYDWEKNRGQQEQLNAAGVKVRLLPLSHGLWDKLGSHFGRYREYALFRGPAPDLAVISQASNFCGYPWMYRCHENGWPYVSIAHVANELVWPPDETLRGLITFYSAARRAFFVSEHTLTYTECQMGIKLGNASLVFNPFGVPYETPWNWPSSEEPLRLACVARLEPQHKGQDLLLRVFSADKWKKRACSLHFFGEGRQEKALRRLASHLNVPVFFEGHSGDVAGVWKDHHALLLPSRCEGRSISIVEAMLCHRPCLATAVGGTPELIEDGLTGFLAPFPTVDALDDALERLWAERGRLPEMGRAAGAAIRRMMPADPVEVFAERLIGLAGVKESESAHGS